MPSLNTTDDIHGNCALFTLVQDDGEIDNFAMILANLQSPLKKALAAQATQVAPKPMQPPLPLAPTPIFTAAPLPQALFPVSLPTSAPSSCASSPSRPSSPASAFTSPSAMMHSSESQSHNKKKRQRTSPDQLLILEQIFETDKMPNQQKRIRLAEQLGMSSRRIQIWFQNKRAKVKRISGKQQNQLSETTSTPNTPESGHNTDSAPSSPQNLFSPPSSPGRDNTPKKFVSAPSVPVAAQASSQPGMPQMHFIYHTADPSFQLKDISKEGKGVQLPAGYLDARLLDSRLLAAVQEGQQAYPTLDQLSMNSHHHFGFFHAMPASRPQQAQNPAPQTQQTSQATMKNCTASASVHASPLEHQQVLLSRTVRL